MSQIFRYCFCETCRSIQSHEIIQKGTKTKQDGIWVKYLSVCQNCERKLDLKQIKSYIIPFYCIPVKDFNALVNKEIYSFKT